MKELQKRLLTAVIVLGTAFGTAGTITVRAEDDNVQATSGQENEVQKVVTEYSDLWTGKIAFKVGEPVKWYVNVPEGTEPKGCSATVKIPGLGYGTESNDKDEDHVTRTQGENFIYEFTPESEGDFIFTCWMGSGCHSNNLHVTADGTYSASAPEDPTDIRAEWNGDEVNVSFTESSVPDGAKITGYKVIATDADGKRVKGTGTSSPVTLKNLDSGKNYTIKITTLATSGSSAGENSIVLLAEKSYAAEPSSETQAEKEAIQTEKAENADQVIETQALQTTQNTETTSTAAVSDTTSDVTTVSQPVTSISEVTVTSETSVSSTPVTTVASSAVSNISQTPKTGGSKSGPLALLTAVLLGSAGTVYFTGRKKK